MKKTLIAESFDSRTLANMEVALERACKGLSIGVEDHSIRRHIAGKILKCAEAGDRTLGGLTAVGRAAATGLRAVSAGDWFSLKRLRQPIGPPRRRGGLNISIQLMPSVMAASVPTIMMPAASAPTVVVAATAASHMPVTMTMAALYKDDAIAVGQHIWFCDWHRRCR
jgi:hypothetical protein